MALDEERTKMSAEPFKYNTNTLVDKIATAIPSFLGSLPEDEIRVLGEVIAIRKASAFMEITLLDPTDGATSFSARLPPGLPPPSLGYVVGVTGRLDVKCDGPTMEVFLQGSTLDQSTSPGRNHVVREDCLVRLLAQIDGAKVRTLAMPLRRIGLVTGANTRAEYDFRTRLTGGRFRVEVKLFPVRLRDAADIADGIERAGNDDDVDAIVIARGGGAPYDLHHFNQPQVLEAIATAVCQKFVLTAIGNAQDETLADQLASHSEPVPTAAATYLNRQYFEFEKGLRDAGARPTSAPWDSRPKRGPVSRIKSWFRLWLRRATIFTLGALTGTLAVPPFLAHFNRRQPNPDVKSSLPTNGFSSSKRRPEAEGHTARSGDARTAAGKKRPDDPSKSERQSGGAP
jgi:hypothetical protein